MEFEGPEGRTPDQKEYAEWSAEDSSDEDESITGYIIISRPRTLKKFKEILTEEELIP